MEKCRVCCSLTDVVINLSFLRLPVCQRCCDIITIQNVRWLIDNKSEVQDGN